MYSCALWGDAEGGVNGDLECGPQLGDAIRRDRGGAEGGGQREGAPSREVRDPAARSREAARPGDQQHAERQFAPEGVLDPADDLDGEQGVPSQGEEVVVDADAVEAERLLPHPGDDPLGVVARGDVAGREGRPE